MKLKTTKKDVMSSYNNIISIGYCDAQFLLRGVEPIAYTHGVYGWNADIYNVDGVAIVTGYRPFGTIHASYNGIVKKYDEKARKLLRDYNADYKKQLAKVNKLLHKFIEEATKGV